MKINILTVALILGLTAPAAAHITLETGEARAGGYYKAVFRVPHGCDGAATTRISIRIPEGVIAVKPQPKPGWTETTRIGKYLQTYENHGKTLTAGVVEVTWEGGPLADDRFDEFAFQAKLPNDPEIMMLFFPVAQTCEKGATNWDEIAMPGTDPHSLARPAPMLHLSHDGMPAHHH